jgi:DNA invertase Pin-like site-specific DNA recombinase
MLEAVLADASHGEFKVLVTWSLDRLTRLGGEHLLELLGHLADRNVAVISWSEPWVENMRDEAVRKFLVYLMGWMGEAESRLRAERSRSGQRRALEQGKHIGRPKGRKDADAGNPVQREASRLRRSAGQKGRRLREMARRSTAAKLAPHDKGS